MWWRPINDPRCINLAEHDHIPKGTNVAFQWWAVVMHLITDWAFELMDLWHWTKGENTPRLEAMLIQHALWVWGVHRCDTGQVSSKLSQKSGQDVLKMTQCDKEIRWTCANGVHRFCGLTKSQSNSNSSLVKRTFPCEEEIVLCNIGQSFGIKSNSRAIVYECEASQSIVPARVCWLNGRLDECNT